MYGAAFDELLGIQLHAVAFVHLRRQFDGGDRGQPYITQVGGNVEVVDFNDVRHQRMQLLFQHVQRCGNSFLLGLACGRRVG